MATVDKNFRIKNGLVVEGSTATVNGNSILTENASDQYILNLIGGETLVKSVDNVFSVDGSGKLSLNTGVSLQIRQTGPSTYGLELDASGVASTGLTNDGPAQLKIDRTTVDTWYDAAGSATTAESNANIYTDNQLEAYTPSSSLDATIDGYGYLKSADLPTMYTDADAINAIANTLGSGLQIQAQGTPSATISVDTSVIATSAYVDDASTVAENNAKSYADSLASNYDAVGAASNAEAAANTYTDNQINALTTDDIEEGTTNKYYTDSRVQFKLGNSVGSGLSFNNTTGVISVDTNDIATVNYVDTAINNLVDGAPGLLDTLNEIAAAINDDANYFTTVTNAINAKQNSLTAGSNIDISNDTISVTGLTTDEVSEGSNLYFTDGRAQTAVDNTDRSFTSVSVNEVSKVVAATTGNIATAAQTAVYVWSDTSYRSGKFLVKIKNGSHTEVSEVLVTLDTSNNVYITEFGMSSTSGSSLGTISADWAIPNSVRLLVTPANDNSEVMVVGTLIV